MNESLGVALANHQRRMTGAISFIRLDIVQATGGQTAFGSAHDAAR